MLLHRSLLEGMVQFTGATPSNAQVAEVLAKELKADLSLIVMKHLYTIFGQQQAKFEALLYHAAEAKKKMEVLTHHQKKKMEEDKKKVEEATKAAPTA